MKKSLFILVAAFLAFFSCQKVDPVRTEEGRKYSLSQLDFNLSIDFKDATKGVRQGWRDGDTVFIFFPDVHDAYLTVGYDGSTWQATPTAVGNSSSVDELDINGVLTAVYLPYRGSVKPVWDSAKGIWHFPGFHDYYYIKSEKTAYFITDGNDVLPTLGSYIYMDTADNFIQLFIPDESATGTIQFACNSVIPAGIGGISSDGTVSDSTETQGYWFTARADTIAGEKGYYASAKLSPRPGSQYYFAINAGGSYKHYYKQRNNVLTGRGAYQLPAIGNWLSVSDTTCVQVNGNSWYTVNLGASTPWELGTSKTVAEISSISQPHAVVPADDAWNLLLDRTIVSWIQVSLLGVDGFLVMDRTVPDGYFFLPNNNSGNGINYWSKTQTEGAQHYMKTDIEGTHELTRTDPPASAQVRMISSLYGGNFAPPEDGGEI